MRAAGIAAAAFAARALWLVANSNERIPHRRGSGRLPHLSIIVPARNEERQIEQCVRSLLEQNYSDFEVIVVDDRSDDETPAILHRIAAREPRLRVIAGAPLPDGWIGKPWALLQGAQAAKGDWLLFTDADTIHSRDASASAVAYAAANDARIVSLLPRQCFETLGERVFLPTILWMIAFAVGSLRAINDPKRSDAAIFNGQYVLFERGAYAALGTHAAVRDKIAEDYEFARLAKRDGRFHARLAGAKDLVRTRMYRSTEEIWSGFGKNLFAGLRANGAQSALGIFWLAALSPLPEVLLASALAKRRFRRATAIAGTIAISSAAAEIGMQRSGYPRGSGAFFPLGAAFMLAACANSARLHVTGRVQWRGRRYGPSGARRRTSPDETQTPGGYGHRDAAAG